MSLRANPSRHGAARSVHSRGDAGEVIAVALMSILLLVPLLLTMLAAMGAGFLVRSTGRVPERAHDALNAVILEVTMPALILVSLHDQHLNPSMATAVIAACGALLVSLVVSMLVARALGLSLPAQGSLSLTSAFCNTGFLGVPITLAVYGGRPGAAMTAILIDAVATTLLLWTLGVAWASHFGGQRRFDLSVLVRLAKLPLTWALVIGLVLSITGVALPSPLATTLKTIGGVTGVLVFLSLGMQIDPRVLRGNVRAIALVMAVKLVVSPSVAWFLVRALGVRGVGADVAVLQSAMPTAMVSAIVATRYGCDARLAAAAAVLTTVGALVTLPVVLQVVG